MAKTLTIKDPVSGELYAGIYPQDRRDHGEAGLHCGRC